MRGSKTVNGEGFGSESTYPDLNLTIVTGSKSRSEYSMDLVLKYQIQMLMDPDIQIRTWTQNLKHSRIS